MGFPPGDIGINVMMNKTLEDLTKGPHFTYKKDETAETTVFHVYFKENYYISYSAPEELVKIIVEAIERVFFFGGKYALDQLSTTLENDREDKRTNE